MMMQPDATPLTKRDDDDAIDWLTHLFRRERVEQGLSPGDRAELRRMDPEGVLPRACWRLLTETGVSGEAGERAWAVLIGTMLDLAAGEAPSVGRVLASPGNGANGYAEQRFLRLLRARGLAEVAHETRQAARWCAAHGGRMRFSSERRGMNGFGLFILAAVQGRDEDAERRAHAIARDYFATQHRADQAPES